MILIHYCRFLFILINLSLSNQGFYMRIFTTVDDVRLWSWLQVIFSQQVIGYPSRRDLRLKCELFGLAGHYLLTLRSKLYTAVPVMDSEPAHLKVHTCSSAFAPQYLLESRASQCTTPYGNIAQYNKTQNHSNKSGNLQRNKQKDDNNSKLLTRQLQLYSTGFM
jgi:hypothetical protein